MINNLFIWIGSPKPCLRVVQSRRHFFFEKRFAFFEKARFGVPKPCLLRFRLAAVFCFFEKRRAFFEKMFFQKPTFLVNI